MMSIFSDAVAQETYETELAGLYWRLTKTSSGLILKCSGYSEHLTDFALQILTNFFKDQSSAKKPFLTEKFLVPMKDKYLRNYKNYFESKRADTYAAYYTDFLISSRGNGIDYDTAIIERCTLDQLRNYHNDVISSPQISECLYAGNVSEKQAIRFFKAAQDIINKCSKDSSQRIHLPGKLDNVLINIICSKEFNHIIL
jgi:secreted Zn-dependent insulinase-like peptidase